MELLFRALKFFSLSGPAFNLLPLLVVGPLVEDLFGGSQKVGRKYSPTKDVINLYATQNRFNPVFKIIINLS